MQQFQQEITRNMMKIIVVLCLVSVVLSAPVVPDTVTPIVPVLAQNFVRDDFGQYSYNFLGGDGSARTEQGALKPNADHTANVLVQKGSYSYIAPNGETVALEYIADELGFRVLSGTHLPTPPPLPIV